jgi:hypothetical protein
MKILELAQKLKTIYDEHGDLDVKVDDDDYSVWAVRGVRVEEVEDDDDDLYSHVYPPMSPGSKFVLIKS